MSKRDRKCEISRFTVPEEVKAAAEAAARAQDRSLTWWIKSAMVEKLARDAAADQA